jgi:large subunit ribosomal protein L10
MGSLPKKQALVASLTQTVANANIILLADYRGLTNAELTDLRTELRQADIKLTVGKNTLVKRAALGTDLAKLAPYLKGPNALVVGYGDQVSAVKIVNAFFKKRKKTNRLVAGFLDGDALTAEDVKQLGDLPPLEELRGKLVMCIAHPANSLVAALASPATGLVRVMDAYNEQRQGA